MVGKATFDENGQSDGRLRVRKMNCLFVDSNIHLSLAFCQDAAKLKAEIIPVAFHETAKLARHALNDYVEEVMHGGTGDCFAPDMIDQNTRLVLVNGMCFKSR